MRSQFSPSLLAFAIDFFLYNIAKELRECRSFRQSSVRKRVGSIRKRPIVVSQTSNIGLLMVFHFKILQRDSHVAHSHFETVIIHAGKVLNLNVALWNCSEGLM